MGLIVLGVMLGLGGLGMLLAVMLGRVTAQRLREAPLSPVEELEPEVSARYQQRWDWMAKNRFLPQFAGALALTGLVVFVVGLVISN